MGLRVITASGRLPKRSVAGRRLLGMALCVATLGIGFLFVLVDDRRRGLHDLVAGTLVVHGDASPPLPAIEVEADDRRSAGVGAPHTPSGVYAPTGRQARAVADVGAHWEG
jgi:hypothetical protein